MSRIEELIAELCPDGVEYRPLSEVVRIRNGRDYKCLGGGEVPVYGSGGVMTYVDTAAYTKPSVLIPRKGSLNKLYYVDVPFWTVDTIFYTEIDDQHLEPKFLYYFLATRRLEDMNQAGGVPSLTQTVLNALRIPVPPLEVQREIVRILDLFTTLEAELEAELEARRRQYAHYRDSLLTFPDDSVRWVKLGEVATYTRGVTYSKAEEIRDGRSGYRVLRSNNIDLTGNRLDLGDVRIVSDRVRIRPDQWLKKDDILISAASGSRAHVGKVAYVHEDTGCAFGGFMAVLRATGEILPRFLFHLLVGRVFASYLESAIASTTINNLTAGIVGDFEIPLPPLEEQRRIVEILDKFDALVNDLSSGLPAEIAARRKQYEYYRDKLLTFSEKVA